MIALGGSIGIGLFIGSGGALATGGPASIFIGFVLVGIMLFTVVNALGELAVVFPIQGECDNWFLNGVIYIRYLTVATKYPGLLYSRWPDR